MKINKLFIEAFMYTKDIKSLNELAREIGISEAQMNRIWNGKRNAGAQTISKMLSYFDVKFEKLFSNGD